MKNLAIFLLLMLAVPAVTFAQHHPGHPGHPGPLIKAGRHAHPAHHHDEPGMNPKNFEEAVRVIKNESFDEKRLDIAKHIVVDNPMSTRQIVNICNLFTFESNKLEFAKFAYPFCVDSNMYFMVDEVFTFKSSKEELHEYIRELRRY